MPEIISIKNVKHSYDVLGGTVNDGMLSDTVIIEGEGEE